MTPDDPPGGRVSAIEGPAAPGLARRAALRVLLGAATGAAAAPAFLGGCARSLAGDRWAQEPVTDADRRRAVVIGSGITGLVSGALLARMGHRVQVLEMHPTEIGGHARSLEIDGLEMCLGPQYVWGFEPGQVGYRVLRTLGLEEETPFRRMEEDGFERCFLGDGEPVDLPMGLDRFRRLMTGRFPGEREGLDRFFDTLGTVERATRLLHDEGLYLRDGAAMRAAIAWSASFSFRDKWELQTTSELTLADLFDRCDLSGPARRLLYATGGIFGEDESTVSLFVYAAALGYYHRGALVPERGFRHLLDALAATITSHGGEVRTGVRVERLAVEAGRVVRVDGADGSRLPCDAVISGVSPRRTCALLPGCPVDSYAYQPSRTAVVCCVGLRGHPGLDALLAGRNVWWQRGDRPVAFADPDMTAPPDLLFVGSPTAHGYGNTPRNPDGQALVLFAPGNHAQARKAFEEGPEAYDALRRSIADRLLETLESHVLPDVTRRVTFRHVRTPLEIERDTGAEAGGIYGRRLDVAHIVRGVRRVPGVRHLHLACATVGLPGIAIGFNTAALLVRDLTGLRI